MRRLRATAGAINRVHIARFMSSPVAQHTNNSNSSLPMSGMVHMFGGNPTDFDRSANNRKDTKWVQEKLQDPKSLFLPFWKYSTLVNTVSSSSSSSSSSVSSFSSSSSSSTTPSLNAAGQPITHTAFFLPQQQAQPFLSTSSRANSLFASAPKDGAPSAFTILLGVQNERALFALDLSRILPAPDAKSDAANTRTLKMGRNQIACPPLHPSLLSSHPHLSWMDVRSAAFHVPLLDSSLLANARSLLYWHDRNGFCAGCGSPSIPSEAGHTRSCTNTKCKRVAFSRVDPCVIMVVHDKANKRVLLNRQPHFAKHVYSNNAGFLESGESIEDAVRREVFEEVGVRVGRVRYHSSQAWPFPHALMIGCFAEAETDTINIDRHELEDAKWVSRQDLSRAIHRWYDDNNEIQDSSSAVPAASSSDLCVPPPISISHHLLRAWLEATELKSKL